MSSGARKAKVTEEHREESRRLREIWAREKRPTQAVFGEIYEIGGQSAVANFLNGTSALSFNAAVGFARGLNCKVSDFSPRLAKAMAEIRDVASYPELTNSPSGEVREPGLLDHYRPHPSHRDRPIPDNVMIVSAEENRRYLSALGQSLEQASSADREGAVALLTAFISNPSANADLLPLIAKRLSGESQDEKLTASK